jgi:hypothetical protein
VPVKFGYPRWGALRSGSLMFLAYFLRATDGISRGKVLRLPQQVKHQLGRGPGTKQDVAVFQKPSFNTAIPV